MPLDLSCETDEVLTLDEYVTYVRTNVDFRDPTSIAASAPKLKALANNRTFLLDHLISHVEQRRCDKRGLAPTYGPNVFVIAHERNFAVRAVIWPPAATVHTAHEKEIFSFELAHDHNFDFMTVGYYGPGYQTDLFEYRVDDVVGYPGEKVPLQPLGRWQLDPGRVLYFRKGVDVHTQLAPVATSISINLLIDTHGDPGPQYEFELSDLSLLRNIQVDDRALHVEMAGLISDESSLERIAHLAQSHGKSDIRMAAYLALERHRGALAWEPGLRDPHRLIRHHAETRMT